MNNQHYNNDMDRQYKQSIQFALIPAMIMLIVVLALALPVGRDWQIYNVSSIAQIKAPYAIPDFVGMPFAFFALPHALLPVAIGNVINAMMTVITIMLVARHYAGDDWKIVTAITLTSPFGIYLIIINNIDWIPLAAFLVTDWLAYPMLAMKPQMLAGAAIIRFKRNPNPMMLMPLAVMLIASVAIWGAWWTQLGNGLSNVEWNYSPFPYLIPVGIWLLWQAWKSDDEIMAACSTMFFVPYFAPYSFTVVHVLLAARNRRVGAWLWVAGWWVVVITLRRL